MLNCNVKTCIMTVYYDIYLLKCIVTHYEKLVNCKLYCEKLLNFYGEKLYYDKIIFIYPFFRNDNTVI